MLDAHVSGPKVGRVLRDFGYDVKATERIEGLPDDALLKIAFLERRVLVTHNVADFVRLVQQRPSERPHAGIILVPKSVQHQEFGAVIRGIRQTLRNLSQADWINRVEWLRR